MLKFETITVTAFAQNCSLLWCDATREAAVIDPGGDLPLIEQALKQHQLHLQAIWLTHGHIDHAGGAGELAERTGAPIIGPHPGDDYWIAGLVQQSAMFGFPPARAFTPTRWLQDGDVLHLGREQLHVLHTPGHTPGHVVFYAPSAGHCFVGDVLFAGSIGRTDFPGGNHQQLIDSIKKKLFSLPDATTFTPGHGPESTLGHERRTNPWVASRMG